MKQKIAAVILAGGYSSRMQQFKPLLPLHGATVIESVIRNFQKAGIQAITVVAGHNAETLRQGVEGLGVRVVFNSRYAEGMYSSIVAGVGSLVTELGEGIVSGCGAGLEAGFEATLDAGRRAAVDACLLIPADMPLVRCSTVTRLCEAFYRSSAPVVYPVFQQRRGHPVVISSRLFPAILSGDGTGGLRALLAEYDHEAHQESVLDEGILIDLDTPADYQKAKEEFGQREIPTPKECQAILEEMKTPANVVSHSRRVAQVAEEISLRLNEAGLQLNVALVRAAALLHDVAKGQPGHAEAGARILAELGFAGVGRVVGQHMDYEFPANAALDEAAIVYLADKLVQGDRIVPLAVRFEQKFAAAGDLLPVVQKRWETAKRLAEAVERLVGADLLEIVSPKNNLPVAVVANAPTE
jgi:putative nucleotidyltransferase with HDIG domain